MLAQRSPKDILAGLVFIGFGLAFAIGATTYGIGTPVRMGPGYFPLIVGGLLTVFGVSIIIRPSVDVEAAPIVTPAWRAAALVLAAVVTFGLTVRGLGLLPAIFLTSLLASLASRVTSTLGALVLAVALTAVSVLIFVVALSLRLPLLGPLIPRL